MNRQYYAAPTVEDMKNKGDFSFYRGWEKHNERYNYDNVYKAQWLLKEQQKEVDDLKEQLEGALKNLEIRKHNLEVAKKNPSPAAFAILPPAEQTKIRESFKSMLTGKLNKKDRMDARKKRREQRKEAGPGKEQKLKSSSSSRSASGGAVKRVKKVKKVKKPRKMLSTRVR